MLSFFFTPGIYPENGKIFSLFRKKTKKRHIAGIQKRSSLENAVMCP